jgi:hypothetical protein
MIPQHATILTMRTEHLIEDWNSAEYAVGGEKHLLGEDQTLIPRINTGNPEEKKYLSDQSRELVCEKLCNEIQVYKRILGVSVNLSEEQVEQSLDELKLSCPKEAEAVSCDTSFPDITDKLMAYRGYDQDMILDVFTGEISIGRGVHKNDVPSR